MPFAASLGIGMLQGKGKVLVFFLWLVFRGVEGVSGKYTFFNLYT